MAASIPKCKQRCIRWAKLGCVVFMYDMVGYNDSKPFTHAFLNDRLRRWGYSLAGLQTWNSIRALDWLTTLPDVDPARIGCTGESGGGTQTFLLTALDDRIKVAAPVVMVSDSFQGGCVCENAAGLRLGTDNVEFAALCAPRPMMLVGATGDWTAKTMTRAFPADPRGLFARRVDRSGGRGRFRFPPQLQPDQPQRCLRLHGPLAAGHRRLGKHARGETAAREARGPLHLRPRSSGPTQPQDSRAARKRSGEITGKSDRLAGSRKEARRRAGRRRGVS